VQSDLLRRQLAPDSVVFWRGARILLTHGDPYAANAMNVPPAGERDLAAWHVRTEPLYYPLPALLLWVPFALLPFLPASVAFVSLGAGLFAYAVSRTGLHRLWLCGSVPFLIALQFGQWTTYLTAAAILPALGFLLPAKPNLGLAILLARPNWRAVFGCAAVCLVSLMIRPTWPLGWLRTVTGNEFSSQAPHPIPVLTYSGAGLVLLLALTRWRRPEARLLVAYACVPQLPFWADQLPLMGIPQRQREVIYTVLLGHLLYMAWGLWAPQVKLYVPSMQPYALFGMYVPMLVLVLLRTNNGPVPSWLQRLTGGAKPVGPEDRGAN
jgi:hypothetical protein